MIGLYEKIKGNSISYTYEDLQNEAGKASGTLVKISVYKN